MASTPGTSSTRLQRVLGAVERVGNRLPNPATLFALLATAVVLLSWPLAEWGVSATHPTTGKTVAVVSLFSVEGLHRILVGVIGNFINFPRSARWWCASSASPSPNTPDSSAPRCG